MALESEYKRKYQLINVLTLELLILGIVFTYLNIYLNYWFVSYLLFAGSCCALANLFLLNKGYSIELCSHIINILFLVMMTVANLWLGGISNTYIAWFYVPPIIAAATLGRKGLIFYSFLSASLILFFIIEKSIIPPVITSHLALLNAINHIFIFLLIFTTLYNLIHVTKNQKINE